jgi:thioredoxin-dependent peroxiredoxin
MTTPYEEAVELDIGDDAPDFSLPANSGKQIALKDLRGQRNVVLAFYIQDGGPADVEELCSFSDNLAKFTACNTEVLAISMNNLAQHQEFADRYGIKVSLLSDPEGSVCRQYGAMRSGNPERILFVVSKTGTIEYVKPGEPDVDQVLKAVRELDS